MHGAPTCSLLGPKHCNVCSSPGASWRMQDHSKQAQLLMQATRQHHKATAMQVLDKGTSTTKSAQSALYADLIHSATVRNCAPPQLRRWRPQTGTQWHLSAAPAQTSRAAATTASPPRQPSAARWWKCCSTARGVRRRAEQCRQTVGQLGSRSGSSNLSCGIKAVCVACRGSRTSKAWLLSGILRRPSAALTSSPSMPVILLDAFSWACTHA